MITDIFIPFLHVGITTEMSSTGDFTDPESANIKSFSIILMLAVSKNVPILKAEQYAQYTRVGHLRIVLVTHHLRSWSVEIEKRSPK